MDEQRDILFYWHASEKNPRYAENLRGVARESCHITFNVLKTNLYLTNTEPRRRTWFRGEDLECLDKYGFPEHIYKETDSNKQSAGRLNRRLMNFAEIINIGWKAKKFSVVFLTLSYPEYNDGIRVFLKLYKQNLSRQGIKVLGHCWVLELGKQGSNPHYHVCFAVDRQKDLETFFPNTYWKGRTKTEFVRKDCVRYMSKYLQKGDALVQNWRRFGISSMKSDVDYLDSDVAKYIENVQLKYKPTVKIPAKLKKFLLAKNEG